MQSRQPWRGDRRLVVLVGLTTLPFVVAIVAVAISARQWTPAGDQALQLLEIDQVGTSRTPLVGAWSRWGWHHPGPWPFYVLTPFVWVFGAVGALIGTLMVNLAALLIAVAAGRRRGGNGAANLVALFGLAIGFAQGPTVLMDLWNPFAGLYPLYALVVVAWSVSDRDWWFLPAMAALASFAVQAHIGYLPVAAMLCLVALLMAMRPGVTTPSTLQADRSWRKPALVALVVVAIAWLPALIEELRPGRGNVSRLASYATSASEPALGWTLAWRVAVDEVAPLGAWITGREFDLFASPGTPVWAAIVILAAALLAAAAMRTRAASSAARLGALSLAATFAAFVATSRITGQLFDYLLAWWWVVGAAVWLSIAWSTWTLVAHRVDPATTKAIAGATVAITATVALGLSVRSIGADPPVSQQAAAVGSLVEQVESQLDIDGTHLVEWRDTFGYGYVGIGIYVALLERGFDVVVPTNAGVAFESWQTGNDADYRLIVSTRDDDAEFPPPAQSIAIAWYDPLSSSARASADAMWEQISQQAPSVLAQPGIVGSRLGQASLVAAGAEPELLARFGDLWQKGPAFVVYLVANDAASD